MNKEFNLEEWIDNLEYDLKQIDRAIDSLEHLKQIRIKDIKWLKDLEEKEC
jgi:hypothetical protein